MKKLCIVALVAIASTAAMAQAPAGTLSRTPQESNANSSGGGAADKAQMKSDAKKDGTATMGMSPRMKAMDTNGDGMISQAEYNAYHSGMWKKMKSKNGKVPMADVDSMLSGGPN